VLKSHLSAMAAGLATVLFAWACSDADADRSKPTDLVCSARRMVLQDVPTYGLINRNELDGDPCSASELNATEALESLFVDPARRYEECLEVLRPGMRDERAAFVLEASKILQPPDENSAKIRRLRRLEKELIVVDTTCREFVYGDLRTLVPGL
jgi:hypothetical protein